MSWASHPTSEMPPTLTDPGRNRRRRSTIIGICAAVLIGLGVAGAMLSPSLLGWSPASSPAGGQALPGGAAGGASSATTQSPPAPVILPAPSATVTPRLSTAAVSRTGPAKTATPVGSAPPAPGIPALEDQVLLLTNVQRAAHGCAALRVDAALRTAARNHSAEMASLQVLTHAGADGSGPGDRMKLAGYNTDRGWAENVAAGYPTPEAVMTGWMDSEGHRDNILNCSLKAIGVGVARANNSQLYWTQDFGGR